MTLDKQIEELTMLYSTAREEGDEDEHKKVIKQFKFLIRKEKQQVFLDIIKALPKSKDIVYKLMDKGLNKGTK